jgi:hypothetical protein
VALATSDLGRPRFEPDVVRDANVTNGLLFFDDDSGYQLAHDPGVTASHGVEAARLRGDDHDRLLYDSLGHPPVHRYMAADAGSSVSPWMPVNTGRDTWRFEAESEWPPVAMSGGGAESVVAENSCASGGRVLRVAPDTHHTEASATIALPLPPNAASSARRAWWVVPRVLTEAGAGKAVLTLEGSPTLVEWEWSDDGPGRPGMGGPARCIDLPARTVELGGDPPRAWLVLRAIGGSVALDSTTIWPK